MDSKILLGKILQSFEDKGYAKVTGYNIFKFVKETGTNITILRENRNKVVIPFKKILAGIDYYKNNNSAYDMGPTELRKVPITHITSPVFAILHLIDKNQYK